MISAITRKTLLPVAASAMLVGNIACNNKVNHVPDKKTTQTAIDFTTRGLNISDEEFDSLVNTNALYEIQDDINKDAEIAWKNFVTDKNENTKLDSIMMYDVILDNKETNHAIDFLKAQAAMRNNINDNYEQYSIEPSIKDKMENYIKNPHARELYSNYMVNNESRRMTELFGN